MGSRTVTSVDDIRFTMRLHEFYDQVWLSRVSSRSRVTTQGTKLIFRPFIFSFLLLSFLFLVFWHIWHTAFLSSYHIISFSFFNLSWWTLGGYKLDMKGLGVLGRFGLIDWRGCRCHWHWHLHTIYWFIYIHPSYWMVSFCLHLGGAFCLICLLYISSSCFLDRFELIIVYSMTGTSSSNHGIPINIHIL